MASKLKNVIIVAVFVLLFASNMTSTAHADGNADKTYTLLQPIPCIQGYKFENGVAKAIPPICNNTGNSVELKTSVAMGDYFQYVFNLLIALASVAAVFMIVWGGFEYVTSASFQTKNDGKKKFTNAIFGLAMILCTYIVLKAVNPKLVQFPTSIPSISSIVQSKNPIVGDSSDLQSTQTDLQTQRRTLQDQLSQEQKDFDQAILDSDPDTASQLDQQIKVTQDQIADLDKQDALNSATLGFQNTVQQATGNSDATPAQINNLISAINDKYNATKDQLVNDPRAQQLEDAKNYSIGLLTVQRDIAQGGSTGAVMANRVSDYVQFMTHPGSFYTRVFSGNYATPTQRAVSNNISKDVINNIVPQIKDASLQSDLIDYANNAVKNMK